MRVWLWLLNFTLHPITKTPIFFKTQTMKINFYPLILFSAISLMALLVPVSSYAQVINYTGFEDFDDETAFTQSSWYDEGFAVNWTNGFNSNRAHVDDAFAMYGSRSLRIS